MVTIRKVEVILGNSRFEQRNRGLRRLLVYIGKNEINRKRDKAIREGKSSFHIKTGKKSKRIKCMVSEVDNLSTSIYYRMGLDCMSRSMKRGMNNKQSIKSLIKYSKLKYISDDDNKRTAHYVFNIYRFATPVFFECLHRYICNEFEKPDEVFKSVYASLPSYFGGLRAKGSVIIGSPYLTQIRIMPRFRKQPEILSAIDKFDSML